MIKVVREWLELTPRDALVVEVGAGVGFMKKELRKANPTARYIGGDVAATNTTQVVFDAAALPWGPSALDALVAMEVVEHLETPEEFLREAARVLRPQGHLIVTMPFMFGVHDFRDYRRFTPLGFQSVIEECGLTLVDSKTRGGTFVAASGLIRHLILLAIVGQPRNWRAEGRSKKIRWLVATAVLTPWTVITYVAYGLDWLLDRSSASPPGYFFLCSPAASGAPADGS
jgi:SAM-dependent methyltransferase